MSLSVVGLTGGSGAGKSTVAQILESSYGAMIIDADALGHEMHADPAICRAVADAFGSRAVMAGDDGGPLVDRRALGRIVFGDAEALGRLNRIMWPAMGAEAGRRIRALRDGGFDGLVVIDAAVLFWAGWDSMADFSVAVVRPAASRVQSITARDGIPAASAWARISSQPADGALARLADAVIYNVGGMDCLGRQVSRSIISRVVP